ncbi:MAG TPA: hypothetical protein VK995_04065, partial [Oceanipulchritudo sp.]|nr:hypothetical protein [Oceanipulchritudo sp.]
SGSLELIYRPFYWKKIAFEFLLGVDYQNISVTSQTIPEPNAEAEIVTDGTGDLIIPYVGVALSRRERTYAFSGSLQLETNVSSIDETNRNQLGRVNVDEDFMILSYGAQGSLFLEPLFKRDAWGNPDSWEDSRLAHEVRFLFSGQFGFSKRLFAQKELVLGGMDRVRGYPESTRAGDDGFMASFEYAYHIPRALKPITVMQREASESGAGPMKLQEPFMGRYNLRPPDVFALPDWDFVLKAFLDVGATYVTDPDFNESDATLMGAGIGFEVQLSSLASLRVDWGMALEEIERGGEVEVESGDSRVHVRLQVTW